MENDEKIEVEKVSQEEFVESNDNIRFGRDKINHCIAKYLNNELTIQYTDKYSEMVGFDTSEYTSLNSKKQFNDNLDGDALMNFENLLHDDELIDSKNIFIQWIGENRGHLPGMVLNQYRVPIQTNVNNIKNMLSLDLAQTDDNEKFKDLLNEYLNFENEFLEKLI